MSAAPTRPAIIAHRGACAYLPEHSLAAKVLAHAQGADYLEQDIVATADGVPIVFHDPFLDELTDVRERFPGRARNDGLNYCLDFGLTEIRQLELRERHDPDTGRVRRPGRFPMDAASFRIPTLEEELLLIRGLNTSTGRAVGIYPEIKLPEWHQEQGCELTPAVLDVLDRCGYLTPGEAIFLQCFSAACLQQVRARAAGLPLVQLLPATDGDLALDAVAGYAVAIGPSLQSLWHPDTGSSGLAEAAHAQGLQVHPYTFRADDLPAGFASVDELLSRFLGDLACDGLFAEQPDRVAAWLDAQSRPQ
jgi:glycerophosphoryl diester phosphodiesterase